MLQLVWGFLYFSLIFSTSKPQGTVQQHSLGTVELGILEIPYETKKELLNPPISTQMSLVPIKRIKLIQSYSLALFGLTWKNTPINHIRKAAKRERICSSLGSSFCSFFGRTNFYYQTQNAQLCVDSSQPLWVLATIKHNSTLSLLFFEIQDTQKLPFASSFWDPELGRAFQMYREPEVTKAEPQQELPWFQIHQTLGVVAFTAHGAF